MKQIRPAISSLRMGERQLRSAIADTAAQANAEHLSSIIGWIKDIQRILREAEAFVTSSVASSPTPNHASDSGVATFVPAVKRTSSGAPKGRISGQYPLFFRESENLLKIGWSKKARSEYEHKAPKSALAALVASLAEAGRNGRRFTMEKITPVRDATTGLEVPDYQIYLALAWLRELKLVNQHGRQGYTLASKTTSLSDEVLRCWDLLPQR